MKTWNRQMRGVTLLLTMFFSVVITAPLFAQRGDSLVATLLSSKHYLFAAESVMPPSGSFRQLNAGEGVEVRGDSVIVDLPYFGRAYSAPLDATSGGFHFTSTNVIYTLKTKKKSGWIVTIRPKDNRDVQQLLFDVSKSGMTSLQVISNSRQPISFNGQIIETKKK